MRRPAAAFLVLALLLGGCQGAPRDPTSPTLTLSCKPDCPAPIPVAAWTRLYCDPGTSEQRGLTAERNPGFAGPFGPLAPRIATALEDALQPTATPDADNRSRTYRTLNGTLELSRENDTGLYVRYEVDQEWVERNASNASARVRSVLQSLSRPPQPQYRDTVDERPEQNFLSIEANQVWQSRPIDETRATLLVQGATPQGARAHTTLAFQNPVRIVVEHTQVALATAVDTGRQFLQCEFQRTNRTDGPSDGDFSWHGHTFRSINGSLAYALAFSHGAPPPSPGAECTSSADTVYVDVVTGVVLDWHTARFCEPRMDA